MMYTVLPLEQYRSTAFCEIEVCYLFSQQNRNWYEKKNRTFAHHVNYDLLGSRNYHEWTLHGYVFKISYEYLLHL